MKSMKISLCACFVKGNYCLIKSSYHALQIGIGIGNYWTKDLVDQNENIWVFLMTFAKFTEFNELWQNTKVEWLPKMLYV